jgi:glycosyltransferase involved in cell wall biosynthesis
MISAAGLEGRITLAGEWLPQSVAHAYRKADAFVLPSFHEGYGMVFAEAMAYGLPLIATAAGAIPETVSLEAALLVPPGDSAALARALRRVIAEPALAARLAAGSRAAGARLPEWPKATEEWERAFDRLAALDPPS